MRFGFFRTLAFGLVVAALAAFGAWTLIERTADPYVADSIDELKPTKAGLVLGTAPLSRSGRPNRFFVYRMDAAAKLFKSGKVEYLIVSGNQADGGRRAGGYDEPTSMRDALVARGVPAARIYRDYAGFHTRDSVLRVSEVFGQSDPIVVSQRFHIERAIFLAQAHGFSFQGYPARDVSGRYGARTMAREVGSRLVAMFDAATARGPRLGGKPIALGVDPPT